MNIFNPYLRLLEEDTVGNVDYDKGNTNLDTNKAEHRKRQLELRINQLIVDLEFIQGSIKDNVDTDPAMVEEIKGRFNNFFIEYEDSLPLLGILRHEGI